MSKSGVSADQTNVYMVLPNYTIAPPYRITMARGRVGVPAYAFINIHEDSRPAWLSEPIYQIQKYFNNL